jgi:hypothetical protein
MTDDRRAALEFAREAFHKANEAATSGANLALRMSLLINGGAAVALCPSSEFLRQRAVPIRGGSGSFG